MSEYEQDIKMPSLGADMVKGSLIEWLVKPGDMVKKGDIIAVLETQKGAIDMEVYHAGRIKELLIEPVAEVPVGSVLARLELTSPQTVSDSPTPVDTSTTSMSESAPEIKSSTEPEREQPATSPATTERLSTSLQVPVPNLGERVSASPAARQLALKHQLSLSDIAGRGPMGAVVLADVQAQLMAASSAEHRSDPSRQQADIQASMRAAIAAAMSKSKREIPHYYLSELVDITATQDWLRQYNEGREPQYRVLLAAVMLKAIATALQQFPALNGHYQANAFTPVMDINIANVINLRSGGVMVPAIGQVQDKSLLQVMTELRDSSNRAKQGHLRSSELTDATITVSSLGDRGVDSVLGVIYPPQVAIIGLGKPVLRPLVIDGQVAARETLYINLCADHRVTDGGYGARFIKRLTHILQEPEDLC